MTKIGHFVIVDGPAQVRRVWWQFLGIALAIVLGATLYGCATLGSIVGRETCTQLRRLEAQTPAGPALDELRREIERRGCPVEPEHDPSPSPTPGPTPNPSPTPGPTPSPGPSPTPTAGSRIDFARLEYDPASGGPATSTFDDAVEAAELRAHPGDQEAGTLVIPNSIRERPEENLVDAWHRCVCTEIIKAGLACGYQLGADEITVGDSAMAGARVQAYKVYNGDDGPGDVHGTVVRRDSGVWRAHSWTLRLRADAPPGPGPTPEPGPTPQPTPTQPAPTPAPTPQPASDEALCASDGKPVPGTNPGGPASLGKISKGDGSYCGGRLDFTPNIYAGRDDLTDPKHYCRGIGSMSPNSSMHGNLWCPARVEGGDPKIRQACERVALRGGPPSYRCTDGKPALVCPDNPFQAACESGEITACTHDGAYCCDNERCWEARP